MNSRRVCGLALLLLVITVLAHRASDALHAQGLSPSPDQATVPTTTSSIVDASLATWTIGSDRKILRNGAQAAGGWGTVIYWYQGTIYVYGLDGWWYSWTGFGWSWYGQQVLSPSPSPDQATVPTTTSSIVDTSLATWTIASDRKILRNGAQAADGWGSVIYWYQATIYVYGLNGWWYSWTGSGWSQYGQSKPGTAVITGDYFVSPGQSIQAVLDGASDGKIIVLLAGVHRQQTLRPKNSQTIAGEPGAILSGARLLTGFTWSGSYWVVGGQSQQGAVIGVGTVCTAAAPRCAYPEDLFIDNTVLRPAGSLGEVVPGKWYFDYANDRIYLADDPTGHNVETSVTAAAFGGYGQNVTIRQLIVEKYATPTNEAAVNSMMPGWIIEDSEIRWNHFAGVRTADWTLARRNRVHHNGAFGFIGSGYGANVDGNEIAYNNTLGYNAYWGAGGAKWVETDNLVLRNNFVHHNDGPGLHTDMNNINLLVESNRVEENNLSGIFHEVGYRAIIRYNTVSRNGRLRPYPYWVDGAGILVSASPDVEVYGNTLVDNWQGIAGLAWNRGSGRYGAWVLKNLSVTDNDVTQTEAVPGGGGRTGIVDKDGTTGFFSNNRFVNNTYRLGTNAYYFTWMNSDINENTWRGYNQDVSGTFIR
jgi:hypothetical protein